MAPGDILLSDILLNLKTTFLELALVLQNTENRFTFSFSGTIINLKILITLSLQLFRSSYQNMSLNFKTGDLSYSSDWAKLLLP